MTKETNIIELNFENLTTFLKDNKKSKKQKIAVLQVFTWTGQEIPEEQWKELLSLIIEKKLL